MDEAEFSRDERRDLRGPLDGLLVVEITTTWAGPMCGCLLADFGARVIKVEDPGGEIARRSPPFLPGLEPPLSFMHATVNRNKESLALDLRQQAGRDVLGRLASRADILVENFRPGTMARWGLGWGDLRRDNPRLVYVSISGYGQWGPDSERVGYDPLAQAESGFLSLNGSPEGSPVKSPTFLGDDLAGLHAALAALAALRHRDASGEGQHIDIALLDTLLFQSTGYLTLAAMGVDLPRLGNEFRIAAPANTYATRDGLVMAGALLDAQWRKLCGAIGRPELADDPRYATALERIDRRREVDDMLARWLVERTSEEALQTLRAAGVPAAPVRSYAEAAASEHVRARRMLQTTETASGQSVPIVGPAAKLSRTPISVRSAAPELGSDSARILAELGYGEAAVARLESAGVTRRTS